MALYNDRVYAYQRMKVADSTIDTATTEQIEQFLADDERNHLAFLELSHFEKTGDFIYLHPIIKAKAKDNYLEVLRKANPTEFTRQMVNAKKSIERYTSRINLKKYRTENELNEWTGLIATYTEKLKIMQALISK